MKMREPRARSEPIMEREPSPMSEPFLLREPQGRSEPSLAREPNRERANGAERTNAAKRAILEDRITTLERAMNDVERPLDPPEAWGCEYCNPESLDKEAELFPCGNRGPMFFCSRPEGHDDEHAYCVAYQHPLKTWR